MIAALPGEPMPATAQELRSNDARAGTLTFREVAADSGVSFRFDTGSRGRHDLPEIMGGGVALIDADGDGLLDLYFCNGGPIVAVPGKADPTCRLFRNRGGWRFEDKTAESGAPGPLYAMGAAVADFDLDGRDDLFVTGWRDQRLYHNLGGGRFADVTAKAGLTSGLWSTSAAFADLDGDGDPDLYVANYLEYDAASPPYCAAPDGRRDYCGPEEFPAQADRLYRNNGDGTFTDVARECGIHRPDGRGLGVLIAELTGDNRPDIFVANDGTPCWLFANQGGLRFAEVGVTAGVALDGQGQPLAGMGVALGDVDGDGRCDLAATNFLGRSTVIFRARGGRPTLYDDASQTLGLTAATRHVLGFGIALADFDADGRVDLIEANGHVLDRARLGIPLAMPTTLLRNSSAGFVDVAASASPWFLQPRIGRGLAIGDLDGDGGLDVVINTLDGPAALLRNTTALGRSLRLELRDRAGRRVTGARIQVTAAGRAFVVGQAAGGSYLAASAPDVYVGLGTAATIDRIDVDWPWGTTESWDRPPLPARGPLLIRQGSGRRAPAQPSALP